jgi:ribosomal protein S18 acetylase RimI-like enzyme
MNDVTIRLAGNVDAESIEAVIYQWTGTDKRRERVEKIREALQRDGYKIIVAELEDKIIGVLLLVLYPDVLFGDDGSHILFLLVDKDHRRRGVASKLLEKAIAIAKEEGVAEIHVDTMNSEAERLYRERGFRDDGVMLCLGPL